LAKPSKPSVLPQAAVRTRRAYFDFRFGQLHVRTAFPATGGFDEQATLICLHSREGSSRSFARFLPEIADDRSVYAPDLPGFGESDPAPSATFADAARAVLDLAGDLRLRQVDLLGVGFGAAVALDLEGDVIRRARIALGSVAMRPWRLAETERRLAGQTLGSAAIVAAVDAGFADARPLSSNAYKIKLARNAVLRTIELAARA